MKYHQDYVFFKKEYQKKECITILEDVDKTEVYLFLKIQKYIQSTDAFDSVSSIWLFHKAAQRFYAICNKENISVFNDSLKK